MVRELYFYFGLRMRNGDMPPYGAYLSYSNWNGDTNGDVRKPTMSKREGWRIEGTSEVDK